MKKTYCEFDRYQSFAQSWAELAEGCQDLGWTRTHEYATETCPECRQVFCFTCCGGTNHHEGGKYTPDFKLCPRCGHDIDQEISE